MINLLPGIASDIKVWPWMIKLLLSECYYVPDIILYACFYQIMNLPLIYNVGCYCSDHSKTNPETSIWVQISISGRGFQEGPVRDRGTKWRSKGEESHDKGCGLRTNEVLSVADLWYTTSSHLLKLRGSWGVYVLSPHSAETDSQPFQPGLHLCSTNFQGQRMLSEWKLMVLVVLCSGTGIAGAELANTNNWL